MTNKILTQDDKLLERIYKLRELYESGQLGGEIMPEDANPNLSKDERLNFLYFTLPMALNYQRNSYKLWESALASYNDSETSEVFYPELVVNMDIELLRSKLVKHKIALQPNKQPVIWKTLCETFNNEFEGNPKLFFEFHNNSVEKVKNYMKSNKKKFPYLSGNKISNYWLYVMEQYTSIEFKDRFNITVAPDTHVIQASAKLGLISEDELNSSNLQTIVSERWSELLSKTKMCPIDIHTPLWLWSRSGFMANVEG